MAVSWINAGLNYYNKDSKIIHLHKNNVKNSHSPRKLKLTHKNFLKINDIPQKWTWNDDLYKKFCLFRKQCGLPFINLWDYVTEPGGRECGSTALADTKSPNEYLLHHDTFRWINKKLSALRDVHSSNMHKSCKMWTVKSRELIIRYTPDQWARNNIITYVWIIYCFSCIRWNIRKENRK